MNYVEAADTNLFIRIQVVLCYMQSSTVIQSTVLGDTYHARRSLCFVNKSPTILFLNNICSYNCDMLCFDTPCILTDHSEPVLSPSNKYKILLSSLHTLMQFAEFTGKPDIA